jgi:hypothetical protein
MAIEPQEIGVNDKLHRCLVVLYYTLWGSGSFLVQFTEAYVHCRFSSYVMHDDRAVVIMKSERQFDDFVAVL